MRLILFVFAACSAGILAQHFRQSAVVGYLLAGSIGSALRFNYGTIASVAEPAVALLLFCIGLEVSLFSNFKNGQRSAECLRKDAG